MDNKSAMFKSKLGRGGRRHRKVRRGHAAVRNAPRCTRVHIPNAETLAALREARGW